MARASGRQDYINLGWRQVEKAKVMARATGRRDYINLGWRQVEKVYVTPS